jgi:phosphate transport system substrate-binding protein
VLAHERSCCARRPSSRSRPGIGPLPDGVRPIQLPYSGPDADFYKLFADSEQIAQAVGKGSVPFSIGYDEFSYALRYNAPTAWVENQAHQYTQPFAENIAAALTKADLRPDLSHRPLPVTCVSRARDVREPT